MKQVAEAGVVADVVGRIEGGAVPAGFCCDGGDFGLVVEENGALVGGDGEGLVDRGEEARVLLRIADRGAVEEAGEAVAEAELFPEIAGAMVLLSGGDVERDAPLLAQAVDEREDLWVKARILLNQ